MSYDTSAARTRMKIRAAKLHPRYFRASMKTEAGNLIKATQALFQEFEGNAYVAALSDDESRVIITPSHGPLGVAIGYNGTRWYAANTDDDEFVRDSQAWLDEPQFDPENSKWFVYFIENEECKQSCALTWIVDKIFDKLSPKEDE